MAPVLDLQAGTSVQEIEEMKKPHILITIHYMELGGAESSLIGLLKSIDYNKIDVDLFIHAHHGELMQLIPAEVNILPEVKKYSVLEIPIIDCLKRGFLDVAISRVLAKFRRKRYLRHHQGISTDDDYFFSHYTTWLLPRINPSVEYDLAISFLTPHRIVLDKVRAKMKVAWIHTDYKTLRIAKDLILHEWEKYDRIVSISKDVSTGFLSAFPVLSDKIIEIENVISSEMVKERSTLVDVTHEMPSGYINLLSVGRFSYPKNYDNVPDIARRIVEAGYTKLKWYIVGYGGDETIVRDKIADAGMQDHVILLGKKENPYPYIKACDIYVQPSRYEGKSIVVREAQILCKPVVITNYNTARSQVQDGVDGIIVPMDNEGCARGIMSVIENKELQRRLSEYLSCHDYGNENEVNKIYSLLS